MKKLKRVYVEITSVCNLQCHFCPPTERKYQFIEIDEFRHTLDEIKQHTDYIYLHVKGEPLLHPKIDQLLDICDEKGFKVNITTNGTLIEKVKHKLIGKRALRQMNFSLHSFDGNEKKQTTKEQYLQQILSFVKECITNSEMFFSLRLWNLTENNVSNERKRKNRELLQMIEDEFSLNYRIEEKVIQGQGLKIADRVFIHQDFQFVWPSLQNEEDDGEGFCHALRNHAAILVDGTVVPCCLDGEGVINLGNIKDTSFYEIRNSERARKMYDGFSERRAVEELCRKCGYRKRFSLSRE